MKNEEENFDPLKFKPLSEGLGLNHFAEGLPYVPEAAKRRTLVQFNFPPPRAPQKRDQNPAPQTAESNSIVQDEQVIVFGSAMKRSFAYIFDFCFATFIFAITVWLGLYMNDVSLNNIFLHHQMRVVILPVFFLYSVIYFGYFLIQEMVWNSTLGKSMFGLKIISHSNFMILLRALLFPISLVPFCIGLIWGFFDSKSRCWHDVITDSIVVSE